MTKSIQKINYVNCILVFLSIATLIGFSACKKSDTPDRPKRTKKLLSKVQIIHDRDKPPTYTYTYSYDTLGRMIAYYDSWLYYRRDSILGEDHTKPGLERGVFNYTSDGKLASVQVYFKEALMLTHTFNYTDSLIEQFETVKGSTNAMVTARYYVSNGNLNRFAQRQKYIDNGYDSTEFSGRLGIDTVFIEKTFGLPLMDLQTVSFTFDTAPGAFSAVSVKVPLWWFWAKWSPHFYISDPYFCSVEHNLTGMTLNAKPSDHLRYEYDYDGYPVKATSLTGDERFAGEYRFFYEE